MSELFDEVDEEVRRDQLKRLLDRYGIHMIVAAVLLVAAVGGWRGYQYLETNKAAETGAAFDQAVELSEQGKHAEAEKAFNALAAKAPAGYRTLARLHEAAELANQDPKAAVKLYDEIAADAGVGPSEQGLARLRAAGLLLDNGDYPSLLTRLEPSTTPESTFRHTAREWLALSAWHAGDSAAARKWLDLIANDGETPPSLRSRAEALQALLPPVAKS